VCGSLRLCGWGIRGGQSDFKYLSQQLAVTPLFSHAANADRRGLTHLTKVNPNCGVTGVSRVIPSGLQRHAMGCNPSHRPVTLIQVGVSLLRSRSSLLQSDVIAHALQLGDEAVAAAGGVVGSAEEPVNTEVDVVGLVVQ
jgi:hypothetical protein